MPGWIGAVIPALAQASRNRRKSSFSKKNWVSAVARAGVELALEVVDVGLGLAASGCTSG